MVAPTPRVRSQASRDGALAVGFRVAATATDGVIEAIERNHLLAVEWHPEADQTGAAIYRLLVERAGQRRAKK